jgi:L-asparaginase II
MQRRYPVRLLRASRKEVKAGVVKVRVARDGVLESRTAVWVGVGDISTQALPSSGPE